MFLLLTSSWTPLWSENIQYYFNALKFPLWSRIQSIWINGIYASTNNIYYSCKEHCALSLPLSIYINYVTLVNHTVQILHTLLVFYWLFYQLLRAVLKIPHYDWDLSITSFSSVKHIWSHFMKVYTFRTVVSYWWCNLYIINYYPISSKTSCYEVYSHTMKSGV